MFNNFNNIEYLKRMAKILTEDNNNYLNLNENDNNYLKVLNKEFEIFFVEQVFNENLIHCSNYNELFNVYIALINEIQRVFESARNYIIISEIAKFLNEDNDNYLFEGGLKNNKLN